MRFLVNYIFLVCYLQNNFSEKKTKKYVLLVAFRMTEGKLRRPENLTFKKGFCIFITFLIS